MDAAELVAEYGPTYYEADLALAEGDLVVANQDYLTWNWAESLSAALLRRLNTPLGSIASSVHGMEGLLVLNANYGNPAFRYLSEPQGAATTARMREGVLACLAQEDRIDVLDLTSSLDVSSAGTPLLVFDLLYTIAGTGASAAFSFAADPLAGTFIEVVG